MFLLLLAASAADPDVLMSKARILLAAPCTGAQCGTPVRSRYRVEDDDPVDVTSKDRAIRDDGTKCNVVGSRRCPKRGRPLFRAALDD